MGNPCFIPLLSKDGQLFVYRGQRVLSPRAFMSYDNLLTSNIDVSPLLSWGKMSPVLSLGKTRCASLAFGGLCLWQCLGIRCGSLVSCSGWE